MSRLRVAVVGVGHLGQHHARVLAGHPDVDLIAVADARIDQARAVADKNGTRAVADYRELLGAVDAVSVAVPTSLHLAVAGPFLERGVAAMVEKPLAAKSSAVMAAAARGSSTGMPCALNSLSGSVS